MLGEKRGLDILALLVSIYGSTDVFIREYRSLLADKLLNKLDYSTEADVANVELLKIRFYLDNFLPFALKPTNYFSFAQIIFIFSDIRFGEESLHSCEVMLKDIEDSKRINNSIRNELSKNSSLELIPCSFSIISDNYWPAIQDPVEFQFHPLINEFLDGYLQTFRKLKKPRTLHQIKTLGKVEIDIEFDNGITRSFVATPLQV